MSMSPGCRGGAKGRRRLDSTRGQEACRVSTAIDLGPGDLVSDSQAGVVMDLLAGEKVDSLLKRVAELHSGKRVKETKASWGLRRLLPWIDDAGERLRMAMGAALSFKTLGQDECCGRLCSPGRGGQGGLAAGAGACVEAGAAGDFCGSAGCEGREKGRGDEPEREGARWGVPGIPVDAGDAVALYRVAQESMGRTRGGDGPVLIECMEYRLEGKGGSAPVDPLVQMSEFLLGRKVCTKAWLEGAGDRLRRRIAAAGE